MSLNIGVFLGSRSGNDKKILTLLKKFSRWFVTQNHTLIIGGTDSGLMEVLAKEVHSKVKVKAIYTEKYIDSSKDYNFYTELIIVDNSITKKKIFEKNSDLFIAFPGGVGTLDEIVDIINRNILREINKKLFLINDISYWKQFNELLDYFKLKHFTSSNYENHNLKTCNLEQLKKEIKRIDAKNKS